MVVRTAPLPVVPVVVAAIGVVLVCALVFHGVEWHSVAFVKELVVGLEVAGGRLLEGDPLGAFEALVSVAA
jgi:hypothetical protein